MGMVAFNGKQNPRISEILDPYLICNVNISNVDLTNPLIE